MMQRKSTQGSFLPAAVVFGAPIVIAALVLPESTRAPKPLEASVVDISNDQDHDGIPDRQEMVLGTEPDKFDTDGDGFGDLEELARHSDPLRASDTPSNEPVSVALHARGEGGINFVFSAIYVQDGDFTELDVALGLAARGRLLRFSPRGIRSLSDVRVFDVTGNGRVCVVDRRVRPSLINRLGYVSFFGAAGLPDQPTEFQAAAIVDLKHVDGLTTIARLAHAFAADDPTGSLADGLAPTQGSSSSHTPIPASGGEPDTDWIAGSACVQQTSTVGISGPLLTQEVTAASCEDGFESFCSGTCSSTTGTTFETVDPTALVGG